MTNKLFLLLLIVGCFSTVYATVPAGTYHCPTANAVQANARMVCAAGFDYYTVDSSEHLAFAGNCSVYDDITRALIVSGPDSAALVAPLMQCSYTFHENDDQRSPFSMTVSSPDGWNFSNCRVDKTNTTNPTVVCK